MNFKEWFYSASHRAKYTNDTPAYLAAQEAWEAAHEACAKVCDAVAELPNDLMSDAPHIAAAIRARGQA
jgi:hypothetical protein